MQFSSIKMGKGWGEMAQPFVGFKDQLKAVLLVGLIFLSSKPTRASESLSHLNDVSIRKQEETVCARLIERALQSEQSFFQILPHTLANEIEARRNRVAEFELIRNEAQKLGLRLWLFGGTAASFSHYVKWDLLREQGDTRFQEHRFDYDYTNIYRSTQDLDLVVNGDAQTAQAFEMILQKKFPYFLGSKAAAWEVRSLTEAREDKGGLLGDFGFMNQHTDSNSTGMIELTDPPRGEAIVRDIRDWENHQMSRFLKDVAEGNVSFYFSATHSETPLAKAEKNPPILAVIRALTKAFQYDLKFSEMDLAIFKKVIEHFNQKQVLTQDYTARWIEKNGKKLFLHAVNLESAWDMLEKLGLREKLISIQNNPQIQDSLAWWMSKEPLRSKPVGEGVGRTAASLGMDVVAHETSDFYAYEAMTRSHMGAPNVFISRAKSSGEAASHGDGFYTAIGKKGAKGTGITIRFQVDPQAREGTDFVLEKAQGNRRLEEGTYVVWKNKNAIRVIPESLEMSPVEYFEFLSGGKTIEHEDQALLWKLKRKLDHSIALGRIPESQMEEIRFIVRAHLKAYESDQVTPIESDLNSFFRSEDESASERVIREWIKIEGARLKKSHQEIEKIVQILKEQSYRIDPALFYSSFIEFSKGTSLESYVRQQWLPSLIHLKTMRTDLGDRALESCLFSSVSELRAWGEKVLYERELSEPSAFIRALRSIDAQKLSPQAWIQIPARSLQEVSEKAAYLALHPEGRSWLPKIEIQPLEAELKKHSFIGVFEEITQGQLSIKAKSESFQFVKFKIPAEGKRVQLGSPSEEPGRWAGVEDQHEVTLTQSFEIQLTPVTQLQWVWVMGENPSQFKVGGEKIRIGDHEVELNSNRPVEQVSWDEVQDFIQKLNTLDSAYHYRLATEAEWEYAARSGVVTPYSFGHDPEELQDYGWYLSNSRGETQDVASLKPNKSGIYDFHGNIEEWVQDRWSDRRPRHSVDPSGPLEGTQRVLRGGGMQNTSDYLRFSSRSNADAMGRSSAIGFRLVRVSAQGGS